MLYSSVVACVGRTPLVVLGRQFPPPGPTVIAKLELLNPSGSMKDRSAVYIVEQGIADGTITADSHLIESSSGNFGIALAAAARVYGLAFTCVVDPKTTPANLRILGQLGPRVELVTDSDDHGCHLDARLARVAQLCREHPGSVWINQYANGRAWQPHSHGTAGEILADLDRPLDCLVAPVSTTGTILGLARRLREDFPRLHVVAVDAAGSVIFGGPPRPRPLAGGSSGAAVVAIERLRPRLPEHWQVLTVLPDRGDRYLDQVYDDGWVAGLPALEEAVLAGAGARLISA